MPAIRRPSLGFIHLVPFDRDHPGAGLAEGIELFRYAEELGFDSGWVRTRHLQRGLPSPAVFFGAVAERTERMRLGTAVIPVGYENPFRLAEDLATADLISGGRLLPGLSVHPPRYDDEVNDIVHDAGWRDEEYGYGRIERLRSLLAGSRVREIPEYTGIGGDFDSERVEPHSPGLASRLWYGGGSLRSARWAGSAGLNWLVSNISTIDLPQGAPAAPAIDFAGNQRAQIDAFRAAHPAGAGARVAVARVAVPTDGATAEQQRRYREYVERRTPRTERVHGANMIIATDIFGTSEQIIERIRGDAAYQAADDYLFELPFELELADWKHILHELATVIGPALGWVPDTGGGPEVRLAHPDEYDEVDRLIEAAYRHDYGPSAHEDPSRFARTRAERYDVWVARDGAELLGSVTTRRAGGPSLHEGVPDNELDLRLLGVAPAARRRGIGACLMRHALEEAERQGFTAVTLKTQPYMVGAHRLYEGLGFARVPDRDGLWVGGRKVLDLIAFRAPVVSAVSSQAGRT